MGRYRPCVASRAGAATRRRSRGSRSVISIDELRELDIFRREAHGTRRNNDDQQDDRPRGAARAPEHFGEEADQADRQQGGVNDAELHDAGNPEVLDAVVEAELALQRIHPHRIGPEDQFVPVEMRQQVEGRITRQRAALVGREAQQHLVEYAEIERGEDARCRRRTAGRSPGSPLRSGARLPRSSRNISTPPKSPITASTVTSAVRPPNAISDPRQNAISGSRSTTGGQSAGRRTSARI